MTLELVSQYLSYVIFSYNNIEITVAKVIQVPLILFAMWFAVTATFGEPGSYDRKKEKRQDHGNHKV